MINIGLIGFGKIGKIYFNLIKNRSDIKVVKILRKKKIKINNILTFTNENFFFAKKSLETNAYIIASPPDTHFHYISKLVNLKKNIIVEKPVVNNLVELQELIKLKKKLNKVKFLVNHTELYNENFINFKKNLKKIGTIKKIKMHYGKKQKNTNKNYQPFLDWLPHPIAAYITLFGKPNSFAIDYFRESYKKNTNRKYLVQDLKIYLKKKKIKCEIFFSNKYKKSRRNIEIEGSLGKLIFRGYSNKQLKFYSKKNIKFFIENKFSNPMNCLLDSLKFKIRNNHKDFLLSIAVMKILLKIKNKIYEYRK